MTCSTTPALDAVEVVENIKVKILLSPSSKMSQTPSTSLATLFSPYFFLPDFQNYVIASKPIKDMDLDYIRDLTASYPPLAHNKVENKLPPHFPMPTARFHTTCTL